MTTPNMFCQHKLPLVYKQGITEWYTWSVSVPYHLPVISISKYFPDPSPTPVLLLNALCASHLRKGETESDQKPASIALSLDVDYGHTAFPPARLWHAPLSFLCVVCFLLLFYLIHYSLSLSVSLLFIKLQSPLFYLAPQAMPVQCISDLAG